MTSRLNFITGQRFGASETENLYIISECINDWIYVDNVNDQTFYGKTERDLHLQHK